MANNIMPSVLLDFGLEAALRLLCKNTLSYSEIPIDLVYSPRLPERLPQETEINLYRIAQEAVNNAVKYAQPRSLQIYVTRRDKGLFMSIEDDGKGFDFEKQKKSKKVFGGLANMRERAELLGGTFHIHSDGATFTRIEIFVPLPTEFLDHPTA
jgi:signal transduction histidine kinase